MIIESSANIIRADIAKLLVAYKLQPEDRIGATCDMVEYVALSMSDRSDVDVFNLAIFVQRELDKFMYGGGCYPETIENLASVVFAITLGPAELYKVMARVPVCLGKRVRRTS